MSESTTPNTTTINIDRYSEDDNTTQVAKIGTLSFIGSWVTKQKTHGISSRSVQFDITHNKIMEELKKFKQID